MEYFDVLDQNRNKINKQYIRGTELNSDEYNLGVEIWITSRNKLLLAQRANKMENPYMWESQGGLVLANETSKDAAIRETKEEIGLTIKDPKFLKTYIYKNQFVDVYTCDVDINISDLVKQKEEVNEVKFVDKDEFSQMVKHNKIVLSQVIRFEEIKTLLNLSW